MPRSADVYSLPSGSTITNGDTSDATDLNTPLSDIETDLNTARPILAGGTGATTASAARTNLGVAIGSDVQAWDDDLDDIAALTPTDGNIIVGDGTDWVAESGATARTSLGVSIGSDVQAWDADLDAIAALSKTDGNIIVGNGSTWVAESGNTARTSLGLGTGDSPQFTNLNISGYITGGSSQASKTYRSTATGNQNVAIWNSDEGAGSDNTIALVQADGDFLSLSGSYGTISDGELKEGVADAASQWADISNLRLVNYTLKATGQRMIGFVAQEVREVSPGAVAKTEDGTLYVKSSVLFTKALGALQEAMTRIEQLEERVEALGG